LPDIIAVIAKSKRPLALVAGGVGLGVLVSVLPVYFSLVLVLALLLWAGLQVCRGRGGDAAIWLFPAMLTVLLCLHLPVKRLDSIVEPVTYHDLTLVEICGRLREERGVVCWAYDEQARNERVSFSTLDPISQRALLQKLARDTWRPLKIAYCAHGATILFGAHPSFTSLGPKRPRAGADAATARESNTP